MASAKNWIGALTAVTLGWVAFSTSEPAGVDDAATAAPLEMSSLSSAPAVEPAARLTCVDNGSTGDVVLPSSAAARTANVIAGAVGLAPPLAGAPPTRAVADAHREPGALATLRGCSDAVPAGCR